MHHLPDWRKCDRTFFSITGEVFLQHLDSSSEYHIMDTSYISEENIVSLALHKYCGESTSLALSPDRLRTHLHVNMLIWMCLWLQQGALCRPLPFNMLPNSSLSSWFQCICTIKIMFSELYSHFLMISGREGNCLTFGLSSGWSTTFTSWNHFWVQLSLENITWLHMVSWM